MQVLIAKEAGACYGVSRAIDIVRSAAQAYPCDVKTLGPLIHNPLVVSQLEKDGVDVVSDPQEASGSTLILRTHGVAPEIEKEAAELCSRVIDATCPFVKRVHRAAELLVKEGYQVLIVGEAGHPEVQATLGHAPSANVVMCAADLDDIALKHKVGLIVQTTMTAAQLREVVSALAGRVDELRLFNTICEATKIRQEAAVELASSADVMLVIGGHNSANTCHLADLCREVCPHTYHIEKPSDIDKAWFSSASIIGISAGASTPAFHIEKVKDYILDLCSDSVNDTQFDKLTS